MRRQTAFFALLLIALLAACAQQPVTRPRVVYLSARVNLPWDLLSPASLHTAFGAQAAANWSEALHLHTTDPLDALIVDASAASQIDPAELGWLYRHCVVLAFFNLYSPAVAELVQDPGIREGGWMDGSQPYPGDFYIIVHRQAPGALGDCNGPDVLPGSFSQDGLTKSRSQHSLSSAADFRIFLNVFALELSTEP